MSNFIYFYFFAKIINFNFLNSILFIKGICQQTVLINRKIFDSEDTKKTFYKYTVTLDIFKTDFFNILSIHTGL